MKTLTFCLWNLESAHQSLFRLALPFLTFMVDLTSGNILNMQERSM